MRTFSTVLATLALAASATAAQASSWSQPVSHDPLPSFCLHHGEYLSGDCIGETSPRAAVNARGAAIAAWADDTTHIRAVVADRPGHFHGAQTLGYGLRPSVAIAPDGSATVVWVGGSGHNTNELKYARRSPGGRFGVARTLRIVTSRPGDDDPHIVAESDDSVQVVFESDSRIHGYHERVQTLRISPTGRPGPTTSLGTGSFERDSVRANSDGTLVVCCLATSGQGTGVAMFRPATGWTTVHPKLPALTQIETVAANRTSLLTGLIDVSDEGDLGTLGVPGFQAIGPANTSGALLDAPVRPTRGLGPNVAIDGSGRDVLVYQEKRASEAFSRDAPVYALVADRGAVDTPERQQLYSGQGYEPAVAPLARGAIAAWQAPGDRWGVAIERAGRFVSFPAPPGPGPSTIGEDFNYDHDLAAAGSHAVLAWTAADGATRVSELTLR